MNSLRMLGYELDGVIADVKNGGFDEVCMQTLKHVSAALHGAALQPIPANTDAAALELSRQIMAVVNGSWLPGGAVQVQAKIQEILAARPAQPQDEREAHRIAEELIAIYDSKKPAGGVHGQIVGMEPYIIKASGIALHVLLDAAEMLAARATPSQDAVDAHRYRVLRDSKYQIDEDDPCVTDAFFNAFFDDDLDKKVDELEARYIAAMQAQGAKG